MFNLMSNITLFWHSRINMLIMFIELRIVC